MYNLDPRDKDSYRLLANCFLFFCRDFAQFIFQTLLADLKDPIQNRERIPAPYADWHITSSIGLGIIEILS